MSHLQKRIQLLLLPQFRWYLISSIVATFGTGLSFVAMSWLAIRGHGSVTSMALFMFSFWFPSVILGPFMGVIVDRYSRKMIIVITNFIRGLLLIAFGWYLSFHFSEGMLYLMALLQGLFFSLFLPAVMAFVREIVEQKDLLYANSTVDIAYEIGNIVGMGSAGLLIALSSAQVAIVINGVLFIISMFTMLMVRRFDGEVHNDKVVRAKSFYQDFKEGLLYLLENKILLVIYTVQLLIFVEFMTAPVLLAPFAKSVLHANVAEFGRINAALSLGVVIGGIFMPWIAEKFGLIRTLITMTMGLGICFALFSYNRLITPAEILYFIIGIGIAVWPVIITQAQHATDIDFQGRVQASFNSISGILVLLVYLLVSLGSHYISISSLYFAEVVLSLLAATLLWIYRHELHQFRQV